MDGRGEVDYAILLEKDLCLMNPTGYYKRICCPGVDIGRGSIDTFLWAPYSMALLANTIIAASYSIATKSLIRLHSFKTSPS